MATAAAFFIASIRDRLLLIGLSHLDAFNVYIYAVLKTSLAFFEGVPAVLFTVLFIIRFAGPTHTGPTSPTRCDGCEYQSRVPPRASCVTT